MAILTVQRASLAGTAQTLVAAAGGGDSFPNDGNTVLLVRNAGASPFDVTFDNPNVCSFGIGPHAGHDQVSEVPNDSVVYSLGPFSQSRFNDANGRVQVTYESATGVTVAAVSR